MKDAMLTIEIKNARIAVTLANPYNEVKKSLLMLHFE